VLPVNGSRGLRRLALVVLAIINSATLPLSSAGDAQPNQSAPPKPKTPPAKAEPATKAIAGRVFDAHGKPLADASVWLIRQDDSNLSMPESTVIAEAQSRVDGRFDLKPIVTELKKHADDPIAEFEVWVWKRGFAVGHWSFYGEPIDEPISMLLADDAPFELLLKDPKGAPCQGATVTPVFAEFDYARVVPKPLRDRLKAESARDGHAEVRGLNGHLKGVSIENPQLGSQTVLLSKQASSPLAVTLHDTRMIEARFIFPKGERVDPSKASVLVEVFTDKMSPCKKRQKEPDNTPAFGFWQEFAPKVDRDGRFRISGTLDHGTGNLRVSGLGIPYEPIPEAPSKSPKPESPGKIVKLEVPLMRGSLCHVLVRDAQTKKPLPGLNLSLGLKRYVDGQFECGEAIELPVSDSTNNEGRTRFVVRPGETYRLRCTPCAGYLDWPANESAVTIPAGVDRFELPPIELTRVCTLKGRLVDGDGKPIHGIRVLGVWRPDARPAEKASAKIAHWAATDSGGTFRFEGLAAGTEVTLLPARAGVPLGDPVQTVAGQDKVLELKKHEEELVALSGRVLGVDHKPVSGVPVVIEIGALVDAPMFFRAETSADGSFRTAACFPKRVKYRLTVRDLLDVAAASEWICPAVSGTSFADLRVDVAKLRIGKPLTGGEVVARVNGEPILARQFLERASVEVLARRRTLLAASKDLAAGKITDQDFRSLQDEAINRFAPEFTRKRVVAQAMLATFDADLRRIVEEAIAKNFAGYVEKIKKDLEVATIDELESKLKEQGTSLAALRTEWRYTLLADDYFRTYSVNREGLATKAVEFYKGRLDQYVAPAKVCWQLIEVNFYKARPQTALAASTQTGKESGLETLQSHDFELVSNQAIEASGKSGPPAGSIHGIDEYVGSIKARQILKSAQEHLRKGESFEAVARKFSDGPGAEQDGWQTPVRVESIADAKTAVALRDLAEGATSSIIETDHSLRIVRVVSRIPAGHKPFEEVDEFIQSRLKRRLEKEQWNALLARSSIEPPFEPPPDLSEWSEREESAER
jgi:parvulin-like peptidyl-prolyl isomerase